MMHGQRLINAFTSGNFAGSISPIHFTVYCQFTVCHSKEISNKESTHIHGTAADSCMCHLMTSMLEVYSVINHGSWRKH
jgi:hypothetical protein